MENGFYIAVVGDNEETEPIRVQDGKWYSVGCADPHDLSSVEIINKVNLPTIPDKETREELRKEREHMSHLRETNYQEYKRQYRKKYGRDPGHRRWP